MTHAALLALTLLLAGCAGRTLDLDARWAPLERVRESSVWPRDRSTTIGDTVWTRSLRDWEATYPEGPQRDALLLHEQEHARRQAELGLALFLARYGADPAFMWAEEQRGWALQLLHLRRHGVRIDPIAVVESLVRYKTLIGGQPMIDRQKADQWVRDVLSGRWRAS